MEAGTVLKIVTDSSSELTEREARLLGAELVPLTVVMGGRAYREGVDLSKREFYEALAAGEAPKTSQPAAEDFYRVFERTKGEETIVLPISSALSGTANAARLAKEEGGFENVLIYETACTTAMLRLLVEEAAKHREKSAKEVAAILDGLRPRIRLHAFVNTLEYLRRGGRIKRSVAFVGEMLGVKPTITIAADGTVALTGKPRGRRRALAELAERFRADGADERYPVRFLQTDPEDPARELMSELGRSGSELLRINCAVGAHIGPGAAGIVYVAKE